MRNELNANIVDAVNDISDEINRLLNDREPDKYFDGIVLLYSAQ